MEKTKTTKEVLPHSGKLKADQGEYQTNDKKGYESALIAEGNYIDEFTCLGFIWGQTRAHCKANAELICKAVNNYHKLLDSNRELIELLEDLVAEYEFISHDQPIPDIKKIETAINNAKNNIV